MGLLQNRNLYHGIFSLNRIISDFESGLIAAIRNLFPQQHLGCFFHFAQAVYKNIQTLGYGARYKNDPEFRTRCRMLIALGHVPVALKQQFFQELQQSYHGDADFLDVIARYFGPTWFNRYPLTMWDWHGRDVRTNNNVESWHSRFNKFLSQPHMSFFKFVSALKEEHEKCQDEMTGRENGEPLPRRNKEYQRLNEKILRIHNEFPQRQQNPIGQYLRPLAYCVPNPIF